MPAGRTLDEEEKAKQEKVSAGMEGKMEWRSGGGKDDASSLNMYS